MKQIKSKILAILTVLYAVRHFRICLPADRIKSLLRS